MTPHTEKPRGGVLRGVRVPGEMVAGEEELHPCLRWGSGGGCQSAFGS